MSPGRTIGLDCEFLERVINEGGAESRLLLARQVAELLRNPETPLLEQEQVVPIALRLVTDENRGVRETLASGLIEVALLPNVIAHAMIAVDDDLAYRFLRFSVGCSPKVFLEVLRDDDVMRQAAIAARPDLQRMHIEQIVDSGSDETVLELLRNQLADVTADDFAALYTRFAVVPDVMDRMLERPDLPPEIRVTQLRKVAARMKQYVAEYTWSESGQAFAGVDDAEELTILSILNECAPAEAAKLSDYLARKNFLTPSLIMRACCTGQMHAVEIILHNLSGQKLARLRDAMYVRKGDALKSILTKIGLPVDCRAVVAAACEVMSNCQVEGIVLRSDRFGRRLLEALMAANGASSNHDRQQQIEHVARFAEQGVRNVARKLKSGLARAA